MLSEKPLELQGEWNSNSLKYTQMKMNLEEISRDYFTCNNAAHN